jgi:integrase
MALARDAAMACPKPEAWPLADQQAWFAAQAKARSPFRKNGGGRSRSPFTVVAVAQGYGRYLTYLAHEWPERLDLTPDLRPTPEVGDGYFCHLVDAGYARTTTIEAMESLMRALSWMYPGKDFAHVTRPLGIPIRQHLPRTGTTRCVPSEELLYDCARSLFEAAPHCVDREQRHAMSRDAAFIGILADMAPRLRTMMLLELGKHVRCINGTWWIEQTPDITKTGPQSGRSLDMPLSPEVSRWFDRYVSSERIEAMAGVRPHNLLWVNVNGRPLHRVSLGRAVAIRTRRFLGYALWPHAFRHALATNDALSGEGHPLDASVRLGHSGPSVTLRHYNLAKAYAAGRRHAERLSRMLKELKDQQS